MIRDLDHDKRIALLTRRCALLYCKEEDINSVALAESFDFEPDLWTWCARTLTGQGPDGEEVHLSDCQPGRTCWQRTGRR